MFTHGLFRRKRLLTDRQQALLSELRATLTRLGEALEIFGPDVKPSDSRALHDTIEQLDQLFLIVIVGEFNSGKSSFINALLGTTIQPEGVTPTTDRITLLCYGDDPKDELREAFLIERAYPAEVLRQLTIVDTPGTNAVIRRHEELTRTFVPRADLVIFTTSADRPFTETERAFMEVIKEWGKKIVLVLNKSDILESESDVQHVVSYLQEHARDLLGITPDVFPVSARMAIRARGSENSTELWQRSHFDAIERYIVETLDEETRIRLKLLSPLGVGEHLTDTYLSAIEERMEILQDDFLTLDNIDQQLNLFHEDILTDVQYHLNEIDLILRDMEERGMQFFDETLRLDRFMDLMKGDRLRSVFEKEVVGDVSNEVEHRIQKLIDWSVEKNLRLWQNITDYITRRRVTQHRDGIIGEVGGTFDYNRNAMLEAIGATARSVVKSYDQEAESQKLTDEIRSSLTNTAITGAAALGIGAVLVTLLHGALLDATGILFAAVIAAGGLFILPAKRRQAKQEFKDRIAEMRLQIRETVTKQFEKETTQALVRIREAITPYTRFVRTKREQLAELQKDLSDIDVSLERLRAEIDL